MEFTFRVNSSTGQTIAMRSTREVKLNVDLLIFFYFTIKR